MGMAIYKYLNQIKIYFSFNLAISIHLNDISVLYYIESVLKLGAIYTYPYRKTKPLALY